MMADLTPRQRDCLRENLVRISAIITRAGVAYSTLSSWKNRYADWPEPLVPADRRGTGEIYWWPDVAAFLRDNSLPDQRYTQPAERGPFHPWAPGASANDLNEKAG